MGRSVTQHKQVSDETTHVIDEEVRLIIDRSYARARQILEDKIDILHAMADALIKYETIDKGQINNIMAGKPPGKPSDWDESDLDHTPGGPSSEEDKEEAADKKSPKGSIGGPVNQN